MMIIHPYHRPVLNLGVTYRERDVALPPKGGYLYQTCRMVHLPSVDKYDVPPT